MSHPLLRFRLFTYTGDDLDDPDTLARLPPLLAEILGASNGLVAYRGGFHLRGACRAPAWHALATVWDGDQSLHAVYDEVDPDDIPFAQDALGDQYLLRAGRVHRLWSESGDVRPLHIDLGHFLTLVAAVPYQALDIQPFERFIEAGGNLKPGELLRADPPFCLKKEDEEVTLEAVPAGQRLFSLAAHHRSLPLEVARSEYDLVDIARRGRHH